MSVSESDPEDLTGTLDALSALELIPAQRRGLLRQLAGHAGVPRPRLGPRAAVQWATDAVTSTVPHVRVRELATLSRHHDGLDGDLLAERLVRNAARATAGVGAASGGLAALKWTVPPTLLAAPVLLGVETVAVVAIEVKLVGELHQAYRVPVAGTGTRAAATLLRSWARQRGVNPMLPGGGLAVALGGTARQELADRLARRFGRNLPTLLPLLTGAAVAAYLNRRATRSLGQKLRTDLRAIAGGSG